MNHARVVASVIDRTGWLPEQVYDMPLILLDRLAQELFVLDKEREKDAST